jgi:hypothetical protein
MHDFRTENHARSLGAIIADIREELKDFLNTRLQILKSEFHETMSAARTAVPFLLLALLLLVTGFLLLTGAVVTIVASAFAGNPYAWFFSFVIVGVLWISLGGLAGFLAYNEFRSKGMFPKRTVEVLKADKVWLESEARTIHGRAA